MSTFTEHFIDADGFSIRYLEAGAGHPVVALHGAGGLHPATAYELLAERFRVIAFEIPGFGSSPENERSMSMLDLAYAIKEAITRLGIDEYSLVGTSFGARLATWLASESVGEVARLVLVSPAVILSGPVHAPTTPEERARLYAHPERQPQSGGGDPAILEKQQRLIDRVMGPPRDSELEKRFSLLVVPTCVLFGTEDTITSPDLGRHYVELLPNCHLVFLYDAAHAMDRDRPSAFADVVGDFIERGTGFALPNTSSLINP